MPSRSRSSPPKCQFLTLCFSGAMSLCVIRWSVVRNFSEPYLVGALVLMERGVKLVVFHGGQEFVKLWKTTDRSIVFRVSRVSFLVDHCDHNLFRELGAMEFCLMIRFKISCIISVVSSSVPLRSSVLIPLLSADFPILRLINCNTQFFHGLWDVSVLLIVFNIFFYHHQHGHKCFQVLLRCPPRLHFQSSCLRTNLCRISRIRWQYLSSLLRCIKLRFSHARCDFSFFLS